MKKKVFSLMMTLVLAFVGIARADVVEIGVGGTTTNSYLPSYSFYKYALTQQLYTADEIGTAGTINSIAFYNGGSTKTRTYTMYLVNTDKTAFSGNYDWITVTAADQVFTGSVTMTADEWTTITLDAPFDYDGVSNLAVIMDDNTGSWSSGMACRVFDGSSNCSIRIYSDGTDYVPTDPTSYSGTLMSVKNQLQIDITPAGGGSGSLDQLFALQNGEVVETINAGTRPNGAWMEPFRFQLRNDGARITVTNLDFTPDGFFTVAEPELPVVMNRNEIVDVALNTGTTNLTEWQFVALYDTRTARVWTITANPYNPQTPDVWELACEDATNFPFSEIPSTAHNTTLHNDYNLPFTDEPYNIPDGVDAVYKLVIDHDQMIDAHVDVNAANGKVALYTEDFYGEGGPMAHNYYTGLGSSDAPVALPFEAQIGEGTNTSTYFPYHTLWNYSLAENLFLASELTEAGVTTAPMSSLSWYVASMSNTTPQNNISIWMANVSDEALSSTSHTTAGMTLVYTGNNVLPTAGQWNEFVFNENSFSWDGHSNILILCQRNNGTYQGTISWQTHNPGFLAMAYAYSDTNGGYDVSTTPQTGMSTSTTNRANIIFKSAGRNGEDVTFGEPRSNYAISAGPVIENLPVRPGTYYLVASATQPDYEVFINVEDMPCPQVEGFAFNPTPADNEDGIEPGRVTLRWNIPDYATGWRLIFGSTYHPEPNHDQTIMYPEDGSFSTNMANSYTVTNLWNNNNYFWRVEFNNGSCQEGVSSPIWGFTTHLNIPQNLVADDYTIFNDETVTLSWNAIQDRTFRTYWIYRDGVKVGETNTNQINATSFVDGPLAYNMGGYTYYVTAIYDEGESAPSDAIVVKVSGRGNVDGHVYEQDGTTGIAGATVTMVGTDEFGANHTYNFTTNAQGYYSGAVYAGSYNGQAAKDGYQTITEPVQGNPINITYNVTTSPVDYVLDENFDPVCSVIAEYYPDSLDPASPYVKVYWGCGLPGSEIIEDFETGDFSKFDWQLDNTYPWVITTENPYEGQYCMKSGNQQVLSSTSTMSVTVEVPADGVMSFFGKISCENNWDYGYFYIDGVRRGSYTGQGSWGEKTFDVTQGEHTFTWEYTEDFMISDYDDCFYVDYITFFRQPEPAIPGMTYDFENSSLQGWTSLDADGDGYGWYVASEIMGTGYGHDGSNDCVLSQSYYQGLVLYPDNYLVSPQVQLGGVLRFYACAQDASYAAEHFGVAVSTTTNNNPSAFTMLQEWTMSAKNAGEVTGRPVRNSRSGRVQGNWYEYTVDLSAYSGMGYVAIRHFNCSDMFYLDVDDITIGEPGKGLAENDRALSHYRVYRTNCYNDGPYTEDNTILLATTWAPDTIYMDVEWADLEPGVYKWGVGTVYVGNRVDPIQEERESEIIWSNCLDKDMWLDGVTVNVLLNSADSPEGTTVAFTNLNPVEQELYPMDPLTLDESGFYAFETFRRGDYAVKVDHEGYQPINDTVSIWSNTDLRYVMIEILYGVENVYVSRTGWAMWDDSHNVPGGGGGQGSNGDTFVEDLESGIPTNWTLIDADGDGNNWYDLIGNNPNNIPGHNGSVGFATSASWNGSILYPDNYLVSPQVTFGSNSTFSFWACAQDASYPADHFGVAVSTSGNSNASDFTMVGEWTMTAKGVGAKTDDTRSGNRDQGNWYQFTVNLGNYAGQTGYVAIRHFNCHDEFRINIDDIELSNGRSEGERHLEYYKVMCTSIDGVPIYNHNTVYPFCQLSVNEPYNAPLVEGEHYLCKVAVMYSTGMSAWSEPVEWQYEPCDHWGPVDEVTVDVNGQGNHIEWVFEHGFNPYGGDTPGPGQGTTTFTEGFEDGLNGWTVIDVNADGGTWLHSSQNLGGYDYSTLAHGGTGFAMCYSFVDYVGSFNTNSFLVSPQKYTITNGSMLHFYADNANDSYPESFSVCVATVDNPSANDFTTVWSGNAKGNAGQKADVRHDANRYENWRSHTVDLSAYAGQDVWIAFHDVNYDMYEIWIDDVELTDGAKGGYNAMQSGMLGNGTYAFNITDIANFDERVVFLYNLSNDVRFDVVNGEANGMFVISAAEGYEDMDLEEAVNEFVYNNAIQFNMMDKVQAAETANAFKGSLPISFVNSLMMDMYIQSRENNLCELADPFCTDNGLYEFPAGVNAGSGEAGPDYDCLYTQPNPAWYYMRIGNPGDIDIYMYSTPAVDIDFCCWGPFDDPTTPCPYGLTEDKVVSCSYSANPTEHCMIPANAQTGEYYILVITNYSNQTCNVNFSKVDGSGDTDCGILPPVDIIGFLITQDGEYLAFAGPTDREYTHEGEFGDHEYCVRPIYPGEMTLPDHNFGWSMGCPVCDFSNSGEACAPVTNLTGYYQNDPDYGESIFIEWDEPMGATAYEIYVAGELMGTVAPGELPVVINGLEGLPAMSLPVGVVAIYSGCESEMVIVNVFYDEVAENNTKVALFPNPTNGYVTIQAQGMNRITVVNALGQVVYDTELNANEFTMDMAQFNAGMYMVRISTQNGVAVKRVSVMH